MQDGRFRNRNPANLPPRNQRLTQHALVIRPQIGVLAAAGPRKHLAYELQRPRGAAGKNQL